MNVGLTSCDDQTIRERVQAAGVVGAGGAGFPTHIKLQARVDTFLVNAAVLIHLKYEKNREDIGLFGI